MQSFINKTTLTAALLFVVGLVAGWLIFSPGEEMDTHDHASEEVREWTCSMHPQIRKSEPGACPICGMDLIPLTHSGSSIDPSAITMTEEAIQLASIQTIIVGSAIGTAELRLFGKVQPNESSITTEAAHVPGRIEKLYVNTTGESIKRGQLIAKLYSPELVTAQKELLEATKMKDTYPKLLEAAKEKLRYWKISNEQIEKILSSGEVQSQINILAHTNGIVTKRNVTEGDHVQEGTPLFEIVDLSSLWIQFDGYESQLPFLKMGATIDFTTEAVPGKTFTGKISFIDPVMDPTSRTSTIRVAYTNKDGQLKPDMFVTGQIQAGKTSAAISIPQSAVLWTGERSVVYVRQESAVGPSFTLREVTLGQKQGNQYQIKNGLKEGEEIVMNGAFTVDAAAQLAGKPSMMSVQYVHESEQEHHQTSNATDSISLHPIISEYLLLKDALVKDDLAATKKIAKEMITKLGNGKTLRNEVENISSAKDIKEARKYFQSLSATLINLSNDSHYSQTLYVQFCPMADNNKGASWLSISDEIRNPYFGASMLSCGEVTKEIN